MAGSVRGQFLEYLRRITPVALQCAGLMAAALMFIGVVSWLRGSFVPFASTEDFWRRLLTVIILVPVTGLICGIASDLEDRFSEWRQRRRDE